MRRSPALSAGLLAAQALSMNAISLFTTAFIVRRMGPLHYGEWATASSLAMTHLIVTNFGLRPLFVRDLSQRPEDTADLLAEQLGVRLLLGVLASASAITVCVLLGYPPVVITCMAIGCLWIEISVLGSTFGDVLQSRERFGTFSAVSFASSIAVAVLSLAAVGAGAGPVGLTVAYLSSPAVSAWLLWRELRTLTRVRVRLTRESATRLLKGSWFLGVSAVLTTGASRAEQLLIPSVVGLEGFGVFSAGTIVADRLTTIPDAIATAFYPRVSRAAGLPGFSRLEPASNMLTTATAACVPVSVIGAYLSGPLARILLPGQSESVETVMKVTVFALPFVALALAMSFSLQAAGRTRSDARLRIGASAGSVLVSMLLVNGWGTNGASWSLVAKPALMAVTLAWSFDKTFPGALRRLPAMRILTASACLAALCAWAGEGDLPKALAVSTLGFGVYAGLLMLLRVFTLSDLRQLSGSRGPR